MKHFLKKNAKWVKKHLNYVYRAKKFDDFLKDYPDIETIKFERVNNSN